MKKHYLFYLLLLGLLGSARAQTQTYPAKEGSYTFPIPSDGTVSIQAKGGDGGSGNVTRGGEGATVSTTFMVREGDVLTIIAGQKGNSGGIGGGGGSAVLAARSGATTILLVAGGGCGQVNPGPGPVGPGPGPIGPGPIGPGPIGPPPCSVINVPGCIAVKSGSANELPSRYYALEKPADSEKVIQLDQPTR